MVKLKFFIDIFLPVALASNRNEYQEYFLTSRRPVLRADNLATFMCRFVFKIWEPQPPGTLRDRP
jgi:hypothetical protein